MNIACQKVQVTELQMHNHASEGDFPVIFLNTLLKELGLLNPTAYAISLIFNLEFNKRR